MDCSLANLTINDGESEEDHVLAEECSVDSTQVIPSSTNIMLIHIKSRTSDAHFAFKLRWDAVGEQRYNSDVLRLRF